MMMFLVFSFRNHSHFCAKGQTDCTFSLLLLLLLLLPVSHGQKPDKAIRYRLMCDMLRGVCSCLCMCVCVCVSVYRQQVVFVCFKIFNYFRVSFAVCLSEGKRGRGCNRTGAYSELDPITVWSQISTCRQQVPLRIHDSFHGRWMWLDLQLANLASHTETQSARLLNTALMLPSTRQTTTTTTAKATTKRGACVAIILTGGRGDWGQLVLLVIHKDAKSFHKQKTFFFSFFLRRIARASALRCEGGGVAIYTTRGRSVCVCVCVWDSL